MILDVGTHPQPGTQHDDKRSTPDEGTHPHSGCMETANVEDKQQHDGTDAAKEGASRPTNEDHYQTRRQDEQPSETNRTSPRVEPQPGEHSREKHRHHDAVIVVVGVGCSNNPSIL